MRWLCLAATTALIGLWGCSESDLPPEVRALEVPEERLASAESLRWGQGAAMPAWPVLDPEETWDVVAYAPKLYPVAAGRPAPPDDPGRARPELLDR